MQVSIVHSKLYFMQIQNILLISAIFILASSFVPVNAFQTNAHYLKLKKQSNETSWIGLLETDTELEVLYSLTSCDNQKKLLLKYFNEMPNGQQIKYRITAKYTGYVQTEEKTRSVTANQTIFGECNSIDTTLFMNLPPQWELDKVLITAEIIEVTLQ